MALFFSFRLFAFIECCTYLIIDYQYRYMFDHCRYLYDGSRSVQCSMFILCNFQQQDLCPL